ncbi:AMP-binding protein, partial [Frankia sp. Mgl5]|uniref:AMP-binding protein n=1 Tax=Frankia sp. Mgl5 TaxID=2933793 RepID=UPI00200C869D
MLRTELIAPLPQLLRGNAERLGDRIAFRDASRAVGWAELERRTGWLAGHLADLRLQPGDRAAIVLGNCVEVVESYLGFARASVVGVPINPRVTETELAYLLDDCGARLVVTDPARIDMVGRVLRDRPGLRVVVTGGHAPPPSAPAGTLSFAALAGAQPRSAARDDLGLDDVAWMLYTSGTTGRPKGVLSTQRSCLWSVAACYAPIPGLSEQDRVLWPLPLFHSLSHIACVLGVTAVGASARLLDGFAASEVLAAIQEDGSTFLAGVPTMYHYLVRAARESGFSAPSLRMCLVGGAITTARLRRDFEDAFGAPLLDAYGSTETCGSITINWPTGARVEGSCGLPVPGLGVRLVDPETGLDVGAGAEGEVWVRGPNVMVGYHNQPEATAAALRDGWYRTGDLARRDDAGYFTITGRIKELIIRGGENIHPGEVEEVLRGVPGVADVAVVARPHDLLGEVPVAFLVPGPEGLDPDRLLATCRERLSYFKVPEELYEIDRIPRTASGKITRHVLLERPARLRAASSGHHDTLFRVDWIPRPSVTSSSVRARPDHTSSPVQAGGPGRQPLSAPLVGTPVPPVGGERRWAIIGADAFGFAPVLTEAGILVSQYPNLDAVRRAAADGDEVPDLAVLTCGSVLGKAGVLSDDAARAVTWLSGEIAGWLAQERLAGVKLVIATRGAVAVGPDDDIEDLIRAPLWGLLRTLQTEHPDRFVLFDLTVDDPAGAAALPAVVESGEPQVAVRQGVVLLPRLARVAAVPTDQDSPTGGNLFADPLRTVVVTGADGPVGAALARHLVANYGVRRLLLVSRPGVAGDTGDLGELGDAGGLGGATGEHSAEALRAELAHAGATVTHVPCDLADRAALAAVLHRHARSVCAVFHAQSAAGPVGGLRNDEQRLAATLAGALNLHDLIGGPETRAFVLCSSAAGLLGGAGLAEPAAVSVFFGALVQHRAARGLPAASVSWGPWEGSELPELPGSRALRVREGLAMFDAALGADQSVLAVLRPDAAVLADDAPPAPLRGLIDVPVAHRPPDDAVAVELRTKLAGLPEADALRLLTTLVRTEVARVAGGSAGAAVEAGTAFRDLGLTSVTTVELRNRLTASTGLRLPVTVAFDHPTPLELARELRRGLLGEASAAVAVRNRRAVSDEPVAIVGMACRLPGGVVSAEGLWDV